MYYRTIIIAYTPEEPTQAQQRRLLDWLKSHAINVNPGQENQETTTVQLELCHHDEQPHGPCDLVRSWELPNPDA